MRVLITLLVSQCGLKAPRFLITHMTSFWRGFRMKN